MLRKRLDEHGGVCSGPTFGFSRDGSGTLRVGIVEYLRRYRSDTARSNVALYRNRQVCTKCWRCCVKLRDNNMEP